MKTHENITKLTPGIETRIAKNPLLNIDTFIIPSPYIEDAGIEKDYEYSYVWMVEGEILGYILVYSNSSKERFLIYKIVTSPFGRGRGIGTNFIEYLASQAPPEATIYLYVWAKQVDTIEFFQNKGFHVGDTIVYRNLVYYHLFACKEELLELCQKEKGKRYIHAEEIGRTRHDARKTLRLLTSMVDMLSVENCNKIIEDINRETTTLINMLNSFRDSVQVVHEVNLKDLIVERIIPYIEASRVRCRVSLHLNTSTMGVMGYYVNLGRALVNLISNSLDAIEEAGRVGRIEIGITEKDHYLVLTLADNGTGIPKEFLQKGPDGIPGFVGTTTKGHKIGEGLGTRQIYSVFGKENIKVTSKPGHGTHWHIYFEKSTISLDKNYIRLERRFHEAQDLLEAYTISAVTPRPVVLAYIWQLRKVEILLFDLIVEFSSYQNIRTIYRHVLGFLEGHISAENLRWTIMAYKVDYKPLKEWLINTAMEINVRDEMLKNNVELDKYQGALFKSYGQAGGNIIIFTMDPETGDFRATDRKLAEHLDFVPYLPGERETLLRGEFKGDVNDDDQPIFLGVWSVTSRQDLIRKLISIRKGTRRLLEMGLHSEKKLSFYQTTYINYSYDVDVNAASTLGEFTELDDQELMKFVRPADDELQGMCVFTE